MGKMALKQLLKQYFKTHGKIYGFKTVVGSSCLGLFSHTKQLYALEEHKTLNSC